VIRVDASAAGITPEEIRLALEAENIESRPIWKPLHLQPIFDRSRRRGGRIAERLFHEGLCLPSGSAMSAEALDRVCHCIESLVRNRAGRTAA
jgi:dTDP-4-amino-4,6-dideoxygalactose transaminase